MDSVDNQVHPGHHGLGYDNSEPLDEYMEHMADQLINEEMLRMSTDGMTGSSDGEMCDSALELVSSYSDPDGKKLTDPDEIKPTETSHQLLQETDHHTPQPSTEPPRDFLKRSADDASPASMPNKRRRISPPPDQTQSGMPFTKLFEF